MNVEETIKHLGNHWDLYRFVGNGERSFDAAKRFLMEHCEKPESTARAKMNSFRYTNDSLIKISSDGKSYSIDPEKVNELEVLIDSVIHFSDFDYRCDQMKEWADIYHTQSKYTEEWMERYFDLKELNEKQQMRLFSEKQELRKKSAETIVGISGKVEGLAADCDARLQGLEQRDYKAKGLTILERIRLFFQIKLNLIPIREYRKMEADIYRVSDEIKEMQKRFGGES
ncbi:MAG: hypothetical protein II169_08640 [Lachnospiraceae bacterium]|nr:hypothetical protein [Lachnospiraceae bacterium]